jgi:hypothetical protein
MELVSFRIFREHDISGSDDVNSKCSKSLLVSILDVFLLLFSLNRLQSLFLAS